MTYKILETTSDENHIFFIIEYTIEGKPYVTRRGFRNADNKTEAEIEKHIEDIGIGMKADINKNKNYIQKIVSWFKNKM